jgi:hypothetical protein
MPLTTSDLKRFVEILGPAGARAGLVASDIDDKNLIQVARKLKLPVERSAARDLLVDQIIDHYSAKILRPIDDLMKMSFDELVVHFTEANVSGQELMNIMKELNYKVGSEDKKNLRSFVARQISETALFSNVASGKRQEDLK